MADTQQGVRQQSARDAAGTTDTHSGDLRALFESVATVPAGSTYNEAFMLWLQSVTGSSADNINDLAALYASQQDDTYNWSSVGLLGGDFSPDDLADLQFWFDASDASTITDAGGGAVSQWNDKSVNGRDLTQGTAASRPLISTDGGFDSILFDGTNDTLQNSSITMNWASGTMYVIGRLVAYQNINAIISLNESSAQLYWSGTRLTDEWRLQMPANGDPFFSRSFANHFWMRHEHVSATSAVITDDLGNTSSDLSGIPTISNIDEIVVGALVPQGDGLNMHVHEIIGYNRILTGSEQTDLEEYISSKWGFL